MADPLQSSEMAENSWRSNAINEVYLRLQLISFQFLILYTVQYDMVRIHFSLLSTVIFACTVLYNVHCAVDSDLHIVSLSLMQQCE